MFAKIAGSQLPSNKSRKISPRDSNLNNQETNH